MGWYRELEINGYKIGFVSDPEEGMVVLNGTDLSKPDFLEALREGQQIWPLLNDFARLEDMSQYWYKCRSDRQFVDRQQTIGICDRFMSQKHLTVPEWIPEFRKHLRENTPYFPPAEKKITSNQSKRGFVYLLETPTGTYKIGRSKDASKRIKNLGVQLPFEIECICKIPTHDMYALELELHERFAAQRVNGEFFILSSEDVEYIKALENE